MSWNGIKAGPIAPPSKDNGSKGGKVNFTKNEASSKSVGNKGTDMKRGLADKSDKKAYSWVPKTVAKIDHNQKSTYGAAPKGGVTKK